MTASTSTRRAFTVLRNRVFVAHIQARSTMEAVRIAAKKYGRVEVIATQRAPYGDAFMGADDHRTEGRRPCNNTAEGKARIEAIRQAAIAEYMSR